MPANLVADPPLIRGASNKNAPLTTLMVISTDLHSGMWLSNACIPNHQELGGNKCWLLHVAKFGVIYQAAIEKYSMAE